MTAGIKRGGCQCGEVRYEVTDPFADLYVCHCTECRRQSASAFGITALVRPADFRLVAGETRSWTRPATIMGTMDCHFCPTCGTRLWHGNLARDAIIAVKGGSFDEPPDLTGVKHTWTKSKLKGVVIPPECECFEEGQPRSR